MANAIFILKKEKINKKRNLDNYQLPMHNLGEAELAFVAEPSETKHYLHQMQLCDANFEFSRMHSTVYWWPFNCMSAPSY